MKKASVCMNGNSLLSCFVADSYFLRLRGLIGRDVDKLGGLWIKPCSQIHTYFMSFPIDAVYISKDGTVLRVDSNLEQGKMFAHVKSAKTVLELPAGRAAELGIEAGNKLVFNVLTVSE